MEASTPRSSLTFDVIVGSDHARKKGLCYSEHVKSAWEVCCWDGEPGGVRSIVTKRR